MKVPEEILKMIPYKPGKPISETQREYGITEVYKLASNENPIGISPKALAALTQVLPQLHRYPDASNYDLVGKISKCWKTPKDQITVGNGSDELIDLLVRIYCQPGDAILTSEAAFVAYSVRASASRVRVVQTKMTQDFRFDLKSMAETLRKQQAAEKIKIVFIANPNNPTGTYVNKTEVLAFLEEFGNRDDLLVVFDEAYTEFVRAQDYISVMDLRAKYKGLILLKTLSKVYGLAGLRVGVLLAPAETIDLVNRVRTPFNVNLLAQVAAEAALDDTEFIKKTCEATWQGLDYYYAALKKLGLPYIESQANFVLFDTLRDVKQVDTALLRRGVILRPVLNYGLNTQLRMSVGLQNENEFAIRALEQVIQEIPKIL